MKQTKTINTEVLKVYERMIEVFFYGKPSDELSKLVHQDFMGYGTAAHEFFVNVNDLIKLTKTQADQLKNLPITITRKPIYEKFLVNNTSYLIVEEFHMHDALNDYRFNARLSAILENISGQWLVTHFHGSTPDANVDPEEALPIEGLRKKNLELEEKIKERTRELEIEAAVERVRTRTMAMQHSDELREASVVLDQQVRALGIETWGCAFHIYADDPEGDYEWFSSREGSLPFYKTPRQEFFLKFFEKGKGGETFHVEKFLGDECKIHYDYLMTIPVMGDALRAVVASGGALPESQYDHVAFFKFGYLLFITYQPVPDAHNIFKRFAKVFEQTYTRFLDLQKAESQAREAQIENALEKVRSRTMGMYSSDELPEVANNLFLQVQALGIPAWSAGFCIWDENKKTATANMSSEGVLQKPFVLPNVGVGYNFQKPFEKGDSFYVEELGGKTLVKHYEFMRTLPIFGEVIDGIIEAGFPLPTFQIFHIVYFSHGYLMFITYEPVPNDWEIFKRFGKVFEQTYTRFLDLQKAEAQAREAKIETALEKVRSRTMGMQNSDELPQVANLLFTEVRALGINAWSCGYNILAEDKKTATCCMSSEGTLQTPFQLRLWGEASFDEMGDFINSDNIMLVQELSGKAVEEHYAYMKSFPDLKPTFDEIDRLGLALPTYQINHLCKFNQGFILFITYEKVPDAHDIFKRFTKVFDQTYTRFLDLQKAEAQAREAQIEVAVERVRAKALAMHKSEEILQVAITLKEQMEGLHLNGVTAATIYLQQNDHKIRVWDITALKESEQGPQLSADFTFRLEDTDPDLWVRRVWNAKEKYSVIEMRDHDFSLCEQWIRGFDEKAADNYLQFIEATQLKHSWHPTIQLEKGKLSIDFILPPPSEIEFILPKMGAAFDLAYRRFLDLQKAEAQAREAQIEASLERVRAKSMSMQNSDELDEVLSVLCEQFDVLGIVPMSTHMTVFDFDNNTFTFRETGKFGNRSFGEQIVALDAMDNWKETVEKWKAEKPTAINKLHFPKEQLPEVWEVFHESFASMPEGSRITPEDYPDGIYHTAGKHPFGYIGMNQMRPATNDEEQIVIKFANEFGRAYQRFLDLQKAETQTREAQINLAVERVRAKALAMHKSEEIMHVVAKLKDEVMGLDIPDVIAATIFLKEGEDKVRMWDLSTLEKDKNGYQIPFDITFKFKKRDPHLYIKRVWENPENYFLEKQEKKDFKRIIAWLRENDKVQVADEVEVFINETQLQCLHHAVKKLNNGKLVIDLLNEPSVEMETILTKMGAAFDLAYKRFEDLQKAEGQAREAEIQLALERVRARSLAMHKSEELLDVITVVSEQLQQLNFRFNHVSFANNEIDSVYKFWVSVPGMNPMRFNIPFLNIPIFVKLKKAQQKKIEFYSDILTKDENRRWHEHFLEHGGTTFFSQEMNEYTMSKGMARSIAINPNITLILANYASVPYTEGENQIITRFGRIFEQSYTRFLDLQKAEAQTKEAKIEVALEKVRSRTMGMQKSDELADVANVLFQELNNLVHNLWTCGFVLCEKDRQEDEWWLSLEDGFSRGFFLPNVNDYAHSHLYEGWLKKDDFRTVQLEGDDLQAHYDWLMKVPIAKSLFDEMEAAGMQRPEWQKLHAAYFSKGYLVIITREPCHEEAIFKRFAQVFDLTYTRFLDLKKAEAQAEEAQVELSLERIRAQVTGMQESSELLDIVVTMRSEFVKLGHEAHYFWHMRWLTDTYEKAMTSGDGTRIGMVMTLPRRIHGNILPVAKWEKSKEPVYVLAMDADTAVDYVDKMISLGDFERVDPQAPSLDDVRHIGGLTFVMARTTHGEIGFSLPGVVPHPSKDAVDTLVRFAGVFDLAYRRFEDLKKAEAQARENQIELALEKVRSRTMTMERSSELADTSVVVFKELLNLGIAPNRLFIGIIKNNGNAIEAWATNEDGSKIENQFELHPSQNKSIQKMVDAWKQEKKSTIIDMQGQELKDYFHYLNKVMHIPFIDGLQQKRRVQTIAYFSGGLIGMAAPTEQPQATIVLLERFAAVFNLTYTRFNDLKIAEKQALQAEKDLIEIKQARQKAEEALIELKATQSQLVQQEKLASLGQLTAGIAHEIKNPLNFVNNFSEVSNELIDEVFEELEKLDDSDIKAEIKAILEDVKGNLTKVHEHGTRADSIVKSMLQHSRGGSGKMEPTDLNALIKEYVNLAFHGMRAKKNPINLEIDLQLDPKIKTVSLIGEDFSRVILNLTNNAFDAMRETVNERPAKLTVRTKQEPNAIHIEVEDNGPGIPDAIKDKILQPFFTTKKGTEGTGLGLSITNDIIKAHGSTLDIQSEPRKTIFKIHLTA